MENKELLEKINNAAEDLKSINPVIIDLEGKSPISEYLFICHGTSTTHAKGIADNIEMELKKEKVYPLGVEGYSEGEWILMDYNSVIVHIFTEEVRSHYSIESLYFVTHKDKVRKVDEED